MESMKSFRARVKRETGISLEEMPRTIRDKKDARPLPGTIFTKRGNIYVVAVGHPKVTKDGEETWPKQAFRLFVL